MSYDHPPQPPPRNGPGTAALVLGVIAAVFAFVPIVGAFIAGPSAPLALVFGLIGLTRAEMGAATNKGVALAGTILGAGSSVVVIVLIAATIEPGK